MPAHAPAAHTNHSGSLLKLKRTHLAIASPSIISIQVFPQVRESRRSAAQAIMYQQRFPTDDICTYARRVSSGTSDASGASYVDVWASASQVASPPQNVRK